jgi:hypothetical protein
MNQPYMPLPQATRTSSLAIVSLIMGIITWFLFPIIAAIVAVITGHMAKKEIRESAGMVTGNDMATAGLILGYIQLGLGIFACLVVAGLVAAGVYSIPFLSNITY